MSTIVDIRRLKVKTRFYIGNNHIIRINVRRAAAQAKSGGHKKIEFPHFTGFLPKQQKTSYSCHWTDVNRFYTRLATN